MTRIWRGYQGLEFAAMLTRSWEDDELLVVCPPSLRPAPDPRARERFGFLQRLPDDGVTLDGDWDAGERELLEIWIAETAGARRSGWPSATLPALGVFTSGTAGGRPRCVLYSKGNVTSSIRSILSVLERRRIRSVFCYPQPFHCFGLVLGYCLPMLRSIERISPEGRYGPSSHGLWLDHAEEGTLTLGTPTHFHDLLAHVARQGSRPRPSHSAIIGGAPVSRGLWRRVRDDLEVECPSIGYGATEAAPGVLHHPPGREPLEDGEVGFALPGVQITLRPGEGLEFDGPNRCLAIIEGDTLAFPRGILLRDDIRRRDDGMHVFRGRTELMLNRGGRKFALEAMEEVIRRELSLDALCVGVPDARLGEELGVLLRAQASCDGSRERIFSLLSSRFHSRFDASRFAIVGDFPLNENSKVDRQAGALLLMPGEGE